MVAHGSLSGRWRARGDGSPNLRGSIVIEHDLRAGSTIWLAGWTKTISGRYGAEFVSLQATVAKPRGRRQRAHWRARDGESEPEGIFRDAVGGRSA